MKTSFLLLFILLAIKVCQAQQPNYVSPSPQAATFLKYRDYPVDLSTGLVDITVPLLNLNVRSYQLPINARFHASGRKIDMSYSELGMNWKLEAYGIITREVRGVSDFGSGIVAGDGYTENNGDYYNTLPNEQGDRNEKFLRRLGLEGYDGIAPHDSEYDIFTVSFQGISSSFIWRDSEAVFLEYFPYKVTFNGGIFVLTDDMGIQYTFGIINENGTTYGSAISFNNSMIVGGMSWYIGKILTPNRDVVRFKYGIASSSGGSLGGNPVYGARAYLGDFPRLYGYNQTPGQPTYEQLYAQQLSFRLENTYQNEEHSIAYLTEIESSTGNITFSYNTPNYSLDEVSLRSNNNTIKKVKFVYQDVMNIPFNIPNNQGKTLKEVRFIDATTLNSHSYSMEYYQGEIAAQTISEYCYGRDYWGYANANTNYNMIPVDQVNQAIGSNNVITNYNRTVGLSARRFPDYFTKRIGMLKKITYPTGGNSEFFYESNRYRNPGLSSSEEGPGLRISQIKQSDGSGNTNKYYKYGDNEDGVGWLLRKPVPGDYQFTQFVTHIPIINGVMTEPGGSYFVQNAFRFRYREFFSEPLGYIRQAYNIPVYYSNVTEYQRDEQGNSLGKTAYHFNNPTFGIERKEFYDSASGDHFDLSVFVPSYNSKSRLDYCDVFSFSNNTFEPQKRTNYSYSTKRTKEMWQATYFRRHKIISERFGGDQIYDETFVESKWPYYSNADPGLQFPWNTIGVRDYKLVSASVVLDSIKETDYTSIGQVSKTTSYLYESLYTNKASTVKEQDSKNGYNIIKIIYPDDISTVQTLTGGPITSVELLAVQEMKKTKGNFASVPLQIEHYSSSNILKELDRSNFKLVTGTPYLYKKTDKKEVSDDLKTSYEILSFDGNGNPLEIKGQRDNLITYLWGYSGQFPIARIDNATYQEVLDILGQTIINNFNNINISEETIRTNISTLRDHTNMRKAQITCYTYTPMVGMTSMTDPRGITEYYRYDGFQRLNNVLDFEKNITKNYRYNYRP